MILSKRNEATILRALIAVTVIGAIGIIYLVARTYVPTPAAIISSAGVVDSGGTVAVGVSWNGGQAPYTLNLYASPTASCTASSSLIAQKANQPTPQGTFAVSPTANTYYCASVTAPTGTSGVSPATEVMVNPALGAPKLVISPPGVDVGQTAYIQAKVFWAGGTSPFSVTLLSGQSTTCSQDTTVVAVSAGTNPVKGLSVQAFNFTVAAPASSTVYCAALQEDSIASTLLLSSPVQFNINPVLSASIAPATPRIDKGQSVTLIATPQHGTPPYNFQWFSGATCAAGSEIASSKTPKYTASGLISTSSYSVQVTDASSGTPTAAPCSKVTVTVNSPFTTDLVQISPSTTLDGGMKANLTVTWAPAGTAPYAVQLATSASPSCTGLTPVPGANATLVFGGSAAFSNTPTASTFYCATVTDSATVPEVATTATAATVTVNTALSLTVTLSPPGVDAGQTATVSATVAITGGTPPFTVTLTSGTSSVCSLDTKVVAVSGGTNPATGVTSGSEVFQFPAPTSATYYCAAVTDSLGLGDASASSGQRFGVNPALGAAISPAAPTIVSGKTATLTATVTPGTGTQPYGYQWFTGLGCLSTGKISGQTASAFTTGALTVTTAYSVMVTDSSTGTPTGPSTVCAGVTVTVTQPLSVTLLRLSPGTTDLGQGVTITATVTWSGGTSPYTVTLTFGTSTTCTSDTTAVVATGGSTNPQTGVAGTTATTTFAAPTTTTHYCATVKDSAVPAASATSTAGTLTVNSALATPTITLTPTALDVGQTATVSATIAVSGGTPPYVVSLYSGSSTTCTSDTVLVRNMAGVTGIGVTFTLNSPTSATYYCATVKDNATTPLSITSGAAQFIINPALSVTESLPSPAAVDFGQSVTARILVSWTGGTAPYTVTLLTSARSSCGSALAPVQPGSNPVTTVNVFQTAFTFPAPTGTTYYCARVLDSSNIPENVTTPSRQFLVSPTLVPPIIKATPTLADAGDTISFSVTSMFSGGTPNYQCQWLQSSPGQVGTSQLTTKATCTANPTATDSLTFNPGLWKFYLAVTDNSSTPVLVTSSAVLVTINPVPVLKLGALSLTQIDQGQSTAVTVTANWGTAQLAPTGSAPYNVTLYGGSQPTCAFDTNVLATATMISGVQKTFTFTSPSSTTQICARMVDSSTPQHIASSPVDLFTVNPPFVTNPVLVTPVAIDTGQSTPITVTINWATTPTGSNPSGTSPYMVTLYSGSSPSCASDTALVATNGPNPQTGIGGGLFAAAFVTTSPGVTTYYCATVVDSSSVPVTLHTSTAPFTVNLAPVASLTPITPTMIDSGQNVAASATLSWTGGTSPFKVQLFSGSSPDCTQDTTPVAGTTQTGITGTSAPITFNASPTATTYYCGQVTDGSSTPLADLSGSSPLSIASRPAVTISPAAPSIGGGQAELLQALPVLGVSPFTYQWYVGSGCTTAIPGQTSQTFSTGPIYWTTTYSVKVVDSSPGTPASDGTACASDTVSVRNGPSGIATDQATGMVYIAEPSANHIVVIDNSTKTVVATVNVGILPWGLAVDQVANKIYVTNYGSGTISVISGASNTVVDTITVGSNLSGIALSPVSTKMYVADSGGNNVYVIDRSTDAVLKTVAVGITPQGVAIGPAPTYTVFVTDYGSNTVTVIDSSYRATTVPVGNNPWAVAVNPATNKVYVTNSGSGTVTEIDGATYSVVGTISVGTGPQSITIDTVKGLAYVANLVSNSVSVINLATNSVTASITGLNSPWAVGILTGSPGIAYISNSGTNTISVVEINLPTDTIIATIIVS